MFFFLFYHEESGEWEDILLALCDLNEIPVCSFASGDTIFNKFEMNIFELLSQVV